MTTSCAMALLRAAVAPLRAAVVRQRGMRGFKTSLDWVKAGCPGPEEPKVAAATQLKLSSSSQAMIEQAGSAGAGVLSGIFGANSMFVPYMLGLLAAAKTFELIYMPMDDFEETKLPEPLVEEEGEFAKESRYGGVIAPGDVGLKRTRSLFIEEEKEEE